MTLVPPWVRSTPGHCGRLGLFWLASPGTRKVVFPPASGSTAIVSFPTKHTWQKSTASNFSLSRINERNRGEDRIIKASICKPESVPTSRRRQKLIFITPILLDSGRKHTHVDNRTLCGIRFSEILGVMEMAGRPVSRLNAPVAEQRSSGAGDQVVL